MNRISLTCLVLPGLCSALILSRGAAADGGQKAPSPASRRAARKLPADTSAAAAGSGVKLVTYNDKDIVQVRTKLRYTTLIVLPKSERVLDFTVGDKDFWVVNGAENFAYIKPAKAGAQTNLNLVTASGNVYSFTLAEISEMPDAAPDLKVFVEAKGTLAAPNDSPRFVSTQVVEDYKQQIELAKDETRRTKEAAQDQIDRGISEFVSNVRFPYRFEAGKKPFSVRAMYNDEKGYTYIQARPEETPALYEIADGQPNLINYEYRNGVYVVTKTIERGYLAIGKKKLYFRREE